MIMLSLDLGKFNTMCCVYNSKTRKHVFINAATERTYLTILLKKTKCDLVVMETCGPSGWINYLAMSLGHKTLVCSTNEDAWKWSNVKRKTDKDDVSIATKKEPFSQGGSGGCDSLIAIC
jgi:transposase